MFECGKSDVLNACISNGNLELFIKEFEYGADIRRYDIKEEARPLYEAVMSSRYDIVKFLVLQGVYIDQKTKNYIINDIEIGKSIGMVTQEEKNLLNLLTNLDYCGNRLSVAILCLREILRLPKQLIEKVLFYLHEDPTHLKLVK
ncbi:MAG: hypothetical protein OEL54_04235 [Flavobacteriaceae bacterium]|nr:hypothetical protein [Flavobacteriaceae bacterium]